MDTLITIGTMFLVAIAALVLVVGAVRLLDRVLFPEVPFGEALKNNNIAVGIFLGLLALGICLLAGRAVAADTDRYDDDFRKWGRWHFGYRYDWRVFKAQGITESGLDPAVCSRARACGLMQFMPGTALAMGLTDPFDAKESIRAGIAYDRQLWGIFTDPRPDRDRLAFAFASYNWGAGNVIRKAQPCARARFGEARLWTEIAPCLPEETRAYVPRIWRWEQRFKGSGPWTG